jgi:hypothetical protein
MASYQPRVMFQFEAIGMKMGVKKQPSLDDCIFKRFCNGDRF